ncbi:hypothetical protein FRC04_004056 [Tulasnella sp. 424]|nr:hypothetical protein FRC04_004056 [Tulasnella sp. 424]
MELIILTPVLGGRDRTVQGTYLGAGSSKVNARNAASKLALAELGAFGMDPPTAPSSVYWNMWHQFCRTTYQSDPLCETWNTGCDTMPGWMTKIQDQGTGDVYMSMGLHRRKIYAKNEAAMLVLIAKGVISPPE